MQLDGFRERLEEAVDWARDNPFLAFFMGAVALFGLFFWQAILYAVIALAVIFAVLFAALKIYFKKPGLKSLFGEKKMLLAEIRIAEHKYMKRKLSEQDFNRLFKEKQKQLIKLEALIDERYNKEKQVTITDELQAVQAKKRHILQGLLEEKKRIIKELDIAERRYLKRKIDSKTYQALVQRNQETLISLEAQIKLLYSEANIQKVMEGLKERLSGLGEKKLEKKRKKKRKEKDKELQIAAEIAEQLSNR